MKTLKSNQVIDIISKKVELKRQLKEIKKNGDDVAINDITQKISKLNSKLSQSPLSKN